jgi:hypothetical protein
MTRFWLVRHGPTHAKTMIGWTDLAADLSDTGALQRLAAHLPPGAPVISSDLSRAIATADALGPDRPRLPHDPAAGRSKMSDSSNCRACQQCCASLAPLLKSKRRNA